MALTIERSEQNSQQIITLTGELDGASAPKLLTEVESAASEKPKRLVLMVKDLEYIASAGIRVLVAAKQKMGTGVDIYIVAAQAQIVDTLQKTGVINSVYMVDTYDAPS